MIHKSESLSMAEALEYIKDSNVTKFVKTFVSLKTEKAKELRKSLEKLDLMKLNERNISKIIDVLPEDKESLNKVLSEVNLDEDESKKVLDAIRNAK